MDKRQPTAEPIRQAYSKVFAGSTRAGTHADIVLSDLRDELLTNPRGLHATTPHDAAVALGRMQAYWYIRDMINEANSNDR